MRRRAVLLLPLAVCCGAADPSREVLQMVADAAGSLSAGDAEGFLRAFDPAMAGYAKLRENVNGLVAQGDVKSLIEPLEDEGDDRERQVQFQWTLQTQRGQQATAWARRDQVVKCKVVKQGKKWRITAMEPIEFFAPAR